MQNNIILQYTSYTCNNKNYVINSGCRISNSSEIFTYPGSVNNFFYVYTTDFIMRRVMQHSGSLICIKLFRSVNFTLFRQNGFLFSLCGGKRTERKHVKHICTPPFLGSCDHFLLNYAKRIRKASGTISCTRKMKVFRSFTISRYWRWESYECTFILTPLTKRNMAQSLTYRLSYWCNTFWTN